MSAIAGIFHIETAKPVDPVRLRAMSNRSSAETWTGSGVGFAGRPFAIVYGRIAVVLDGHIRNIAALRREIEAGGHVFQTTEDAEVVAVAWRQWGQTMLPRFDGAVALALFDADRQSLFLARDRLGEKSLHYTHLTDGSLAFASNLSGLIAHPLFRREPDMRAADDFLCLGYLPDDGCLLAGVAKLPAGFSLFVERGRPAAAPSRWWDIDFRVRTEQSGGVLLDRLRDAVSAQDAPGVSLTGGVASAAIVALLAETSNRAIETSAVSPDPNDLAAAAIVTRRFATAHRERIVDLADPALIATLAAAFDEPNADASAPLAQLRFDQATGTLLSSDGMRELFPDGERYRRHAWRDRLQRVLPLRASAADEDYARSLVLISPETRDALYHPAFVRALNGRRAEWRFVEAMRGAPADRPFDRAHYADLKIALPGRLLARDRRLAAASGIDLRLPLLDHRLVEFGAGLPPRLRQGDRLLRKAMAAHLPNEVLTRAEPNHEAPFDIWFRSPFALGPALAETGWFNAAAIAQLLADHKAGRANHGTLLWQLYLLEKSLARLFGLGQG